MRGRGMLGVGGDLVAWENGKLLSVSSCCWFITSHCLLFLGCVTTIRVGQSGARSHQDIQLSGTNILKEHCVFECENGLYSANLCSL